MLGDKMTQLISSNVQRKQFFIGLSVFSVAAFVFVVIVSVVGVIVWNNKNRASSIAGSTNYPATTTTVKVYDRPDFDKRISGLNRDEVLKLLGKPYSTSGRDSDEWTYRERTRDPISGGIDDLVKLEFNPGLISVVWKIFYQ